MLPISVCIIAKNEEEKIGTCLDSLKPYNFEIIVLDTGSTDSTKEIALKYTSHVYDFTWVDDFSAARNASIEKASHDWILIVDCDECIESCDTSALEAHMANHKDQMGSITCKSEAEDPNGGVTYSYGELPRFFHKGDFKYDGIIHEQVVPYSKDASFESTLLPITLLHTGYHLSDEEHARKSARNIALLEQAVLKQPNSSYYHFQLGLDLSKMNEYARAKECFQTALSLDPPADILYTKLIYINYGEVLRNEGLFDEGIALIKGASTILNDYADAEYLLATLYYNKNDAVNAILSYIKALSCTVYTNYACKTYLSHYMLGLIYEQMGNGEIAASFYKNCLDYKDARERMNRLTTSTP
ncbi:MAG: glycosyltransferase [Eubacteriales bacterium]